MNEHIQRAFVQHTALAESVRCDLAEIIEEVAGMLILALEHDNKILLCGNGGSAADAQHLAAELTGRYLQKNRRPLPAIALTTDTSALTAVGNDFGFEAIFARQVQALGRKGDVLIGISTSGNSKNVLEAFHVARKSGMTTVLIAGCDGGILKQAADHALIVSSTDTPRIQEMHIMIGHVLCDLIDRRFA